MPTDAKSWWASRRLLYNIGLAASGIIAFLLSVILVGIAQYNNRLPEIEITAVTIIFQGIGYLFMMAIANLFYNLGRVAEYIIKPKDPKPLRHWLYGLGFCFSVALPFGIPTLLLCQIIFD